MGNHEVGRAMCAVAKGYWAGRAHAFPPDGSAERDEGTIPPPSKEEALAVLDAAAEEFRGADAEFDDELAFDSPLSRLVAIAFEATEKEIGSRDGHEGYEDDGEAWYDGPETRFRSRYEFC
jgi:hypothetical protein